MFDILTEWEKRSTVRNRDHIVFDPSYSGYCFPPSHQPLTTHPAVVQRGERALEYLLLQSLYKYSHDIATIETRVVNQAILDTVSGQLLLNFTDAQKLSLYTIMVDESYHAYVAFDAMSQLQESTHIFPVNFPRKIEIEKALEWSYQKLPIEHHSLFRLVAVCLAENTLTKEIIEMSCTTNTHPFFQRLIEDHLADESRHCGIFFNILSHVWKGIDPATKKIIALVLPGFLEKYLSFSTEIDFNKNVLAEMGFSEEDVKMILDETYMGFQLTKQHPKLKNILAILDKAGIFDEFTMPYFQQRNWI